MIKIDKKVQLSICNGYQFYQVLKVYIYGPRTLGRKSARLNL